MAQQTGSCSSDGFSSTVENAFAYCLTNAPFNAKCYRGFIFPTGQTKVSFSCQKVIASSCSVNEFDIAADNAVITCMTNVSCEARCYRGYIFPNGRTNESYICQDELWTPVISTCKPIPEVSVKYAVTWVFSEVVPYQCRNITAKFNDSKEILEETFASVCTTINGTIFFTYSTLAFTITATFTAKYNNFSNWNVLEKCKTLTIKSFTKLPVIKTIFDNISCNDSHLNHTILKEFRIEDSHEQCSDGMEIHNVTRSSGGTFGVYCDFIVAKTTTEMTEDVNNTSVLSILKRNTSVTETTKFNITKKAGLALRSIIYIAAAAAGIVILIAVIIIGCVCHQKRKNKPVEIKMKYKVKHQGYNCGFKGEMINNELYKSADEVIDCQKDDDVTQSSLESYSAAPYYNLKMTYSKLEPEEDVYSYASKF